MGYTYSKSHALNICQEMNMSKEMISSIRKVVDHFENMQLHPIDCTLTRHFYPIIEEYYDGTMDMKDIKNMYTNWIKDVYKKNAGVFKKLFDYNKRPSLKKFVQLFLEECLY